MDEKRKNFMQNPEEKKTWARKRDVKKGAKLKTQKKRAMGRGIDGSFLGRGWREGRVGGRLGGGIEGRSFNR